MLPALTLSNADVIPASTNGVPVESFNTITPPCECEILTAPPTTLATVLATFWSVVAVCVYLPMLIKKLIK